MTHQARESDVCIIWGDASCPRANILNFHSLGATGMMRTSFFFIVFITPFFRTFLHGRYAPRLSHSYFLPCWDGT